METLRRLIQEELGKQLESEYLDCVTVLQRRAQEAVLSFRLECFCILE